MENEPVAEPEAETPDMQTVASEMESMFKEPEKAEAEKEVEPEIEEDKEAVEPEVPVEEEPGKRNPQKYQRKSGSVNHAALKIPASSAWNVVKRSLDPNIGSARYAEQNPKESSARSVEQSVTTNGGND